jgi:hypothetical protein
MARLIGELVAVDWDENDEPTEVVLETEDARYAIACDRNYEDLLCHVGQEVEIEGVVEDDEPGDPVVRVRGFEVLELMAEDPDDHGEDDEFPDTDW